MGQKLAGSAKVQPRMQVDAECAGCGVILSMDEIVLMEATEDDQPENINQDGWVECCYKCAGQRVLESQERCRCGYPLQPDNQECARCKQHGQSSQKRNKRILKRERS